MGNSRSNDRGSLILVDYPNRRRLKLLGHMRYEDGRTVATEWLKLQTFLYSAASN
ncbi:hypothetical protein ACFL07_04985 [Pseudomonadota bacterium]